MGLAHESDNESDPSPTEFRVSMSNFILGKNPVVIAEYGQENEHASSEEDSSEGASQEVLESTSGDTSGESSEAISAESSEMSGSDVDVVLIPVEAQSEDTTEPELVECEKKKNKKKNGQNGHECAKKVVGNEGSKSNGPGQKKSKMKNKGRKPLDDSVSKEITEDEESADTTATETMNTSKSHEDSSGSGPAGTTPSATSDATEQGGWSISEDALLRGMKEGGETWAEIATAMQRSRSDVKARWKVVEKQPRVESDDADDELEKKDKSKKPQESGKKEGAKGAKKANKSDDKQPGKAKQDKSTKPAKEENATESKEKQKQKEEPENVESSSSEASTSATASVDEEEEQDSYLRNDIYSALYPNRMTFEPDTALSPTDCEVLASADARRHAGRWLEMQANFYNTTGRWIPLHIIQQKCQGAERQRLKEIISENEQKDELAERVWSWIQGLKD
ncbi:hypothetical protein CC79DRAFT_1364255 [Sarocladium strictum]